MKVAFLFPGYGSQFVGMGKELYDESRIVQEYFEQAANCLDMNFVKLCFASSDSELAKLEHAYTALFLISSSFFAVLKDQLIEPEIVAGYNVGQYSALFGAGGITFPDGLYLLNKYALFYRDFLNNNTIESIRVVGIKGSDLDVMCHEVSNANQLVSVGIYITNNDCIVSGYKDAIAILKDRIGEYDNVQVESLSPAIGTYSQLTQSVADQMRTYLPKIDLKDLSTPLISNSSGKVVVHNQDLSQLIIDHIVDPIRWDKVMDSLESYDVFFEISPAGFLTKLLKQRYPNKTAIAVNNQSDIDKIKKFLHDFTDKAEN